MPDPIALGALASLLAGLATAVGALPVLIDREIPDRTRDTLLGIAAGVMLSATFFSLIEPAIALLEVRQASKLIAAVYVSVALAAGAAFVWLLELVLAGVYGWNHGEAGKARIQKVWLFVTAVTLHNLPEGLAVGVGFGAGDASHGTSVALGIGLQNAPEGLAVALALLTHGYGRWPSFLIAGLTGLVEAPAGLLGAAAVSLSAPLLPWALAGAAGAMLFVISHELIPEAHAHEFKSEATGGLIAGFILMLLLDVAFS